MTPAEETPLVPQRDSRHLFLGGHRGPERESLRHLYVLWTQTQDLHMVTSVIYWPKHTTRPAPTQEVEILTLVPQTVKGLDTGKSGETEAIVQSVYGKIRM